MNEIRAQLHGKPVTMNAVAEQIITWVILHQNMFALADFRGCVVLETNFDTNTASVKPKVVIRPTID